MELNEFISNALVEISKGVNSANKSLGEEYSDYPDPYVIRTNLGDNKKNHDGIKFDIAVTVSERDGKKNSIGVSVLKIGANANYDKESSGEQTHRIQFEVNIESDVR
jgi:hypothetical protein